MSLSIEYIRSLFPILHQTVHGKPLIYLDNGATNQKPKQVIDRIVQYYSAENANVHRGVHYLSAISTEAMENTRKNVQQFLNAAFDEEIIFTKGTTESINLLAHSFGKAFIGKGDEVIVSGLEHHANFVPWQQLCQEKGAILKVIPIQPDGDLDLEAFEEMISSKTKIVNVNQVSNAIGTVNPIEKIIEISHKHGVAVHIDGAQAVSHFAIDVQKMDCDFYTFSGHKMYGPMGIGIFYGKKEYLEKMPPYQTGGEMIEYVSVDEVTFNQLPYKFEAGTPNVGGILGLDEAIRFIQNIGIERIGEHENMLMNDTLKQLETIDLVKIIGKPKQRAGAISIVLNGIHHYDVATILDQLGIAVRSGHHCAQPVMRYFGVDGTIRVSFAIYNTQEEIDTFVHALKRVIGMFR